MKKNLLILISFVAILIAWCTNSDNNVTNINPENWVSDEWLSVEEVFNQQIEETQYILDLTDFLSYETLSKLEDKPYTSEYNVSAKLDENSEVQWNLEFSQNKISKAHNLENSEMSFDVSASVKNGELEPFSLSWKLSFLYQNDNMYANLREFWLIMWDESEENVTAKMYTLLLEMIENRWIDLEVNGWWLFAVSNDSKLSYIVWCLENVLEAWEEDMGKATVELVDAINSFVDLWISTNELSVKSLEDIKYWELKDWTIQKSFKWVLEWSDSSFNISFAASKQWLELHIYNIKERDVNTQEFKDTKKESFISIKETKQSEYDVEVWVGNKNEKDTNVTWTIIYKQPVKVALDFMSKSNNIVSWKKLSWKINISVSNKFSDGKEVIEELTGDVLLLSDLLWNL